MSLSRSILAVIAVLLVNDPVTCIKNYNYYYPPKWLMYAEVIMKVLM